MWDDVIVGERCSMLKVSLITIVTFYGNEFFFNDIEVDMKYFHLRYDWSHCISTTFLICDQPRENKHQPLWSFWAIMIKSRALYNVQISFFDRWKSLMNAVIFCWFDIYWIHESFPRILTECYAPIMTMTMIGITFYEIKFRCFAIFLVFSRKYVSQKRVIRFLAKLNSRGNILRFYSRKLISGKLI